MSRIAPNWLKLVLRVGLSAAMLVYLVTKIQDTGSIRWPTWGHSAGWWMAGAVAMTLFSVYLSALRWQTVLTAMGLPAPLPRLLSHYLAGQFVANVMPTTIGGDVLRVARLARDNGEMPDSFASVVLERLTGWLVLPVITFVGLLLNPPLRDLGRASHIALSTAVATLVALVLILVIVAARRFGESDAEKGWRRFLAAVSIGTRTLRHHPRQAFFVVMVGFVYQLVLVGAAVMAARALGATDAGLTALLAFFPAVSIAQALPISIAGIGIREGLFVLFLHPLGVPQTQAFALGVLLYLLNLIVSLLGAPAFALGGRRHTPDTLDPESNLRVDRRRLDELDDTPTPASDSAT